MKRFALTLAAALLLTACSATQQQPRVKTVDLKQQFGPYTGTFKLYDLTDRTYIAHNDEPRDRRYAPASTFKVPHALIALQTGVIKDEQTVRKWDGTVHPIDSWNRDQTLATAMKESVIWYFQDVARELGRDREQEWLTKLAYGNRQIGSAVDAFWLDGSLAISVDEQLEFMTRFYEEKLPFDPQVIKTVKSLITVRQDDRITMAGKTGSAVRVQPNIGWYVGYLTSKGKPYIFVTRIEGKDVTGVKAREITEKALRELKILTD
ncbi:MAG TPA: penicillin-binding transpeptidase domain-containing protein [Symbiobacteriaceae bacterium]|nr:penicillin-binding transpeptidase domain-containing protein [Symbiobacteriaceae bacterium]